MRVLLFGATGMIGQGVLRECLLAPDVTEVIAVGRQPVGRSHPKLREMVRADVADLAPVERELADLDACLFCLGVSSAGMSEARYTELTHDLTLAIATTLARTSPGMTFEYVSGMGTDSTERGRTMWARVKGRTENALLALPFRAAYMLRPGLVVPLHGVRSKTTLYRVLYSVLTPILPLLRRAAPNAVTTTEQIGRAMLAVARRGDARQVLESADIARLATSA